MVRLSLGRGHPALYGLSPPGDGWLGTFYRSPTPTRGGPSAGPGRCLASGGFAPAHQTGAGQLPELDPGVHSPAAGAGPARLAALCGQHRSGPPGLWPVLVPTLLSIRRASRPESTNSFVVRLDATRAGLYRERASQ